MIGLASRESCCTISKPVTTGIGLVFYTYSVSTDLTGVVQRNCIDASHHDFRGVFIHGTLAVPHIRDVLNHHLKFNGHR